MQFLEKIETILQTFPENTTLFNAKNETFNAKMQDIEKVFNTVYVEV